MIEFVCIIFTLIHCFQTHNKQAIIIIYYINIIYLYTHTNIYIEASLRIEFIECDDLSLHKNLK